MVDNDRCFKGDCSRMKVYVCRIQKKSQFNLILSRETESSKSENAKLLGENNCDCSFYAKGIICQKFMLKKLILTSKFYKEIIMRLISQVHPFRPEFY
jgi:hypothetical protein